MKPFSLLVALALSETASVAAASPTLAQLRDGHRLLVVSAPIGDTKLGVRQRRLEAWRSQAQERDLAIVYLDGATVDGISDPAATIRSRYKIPARGFAVVLVGKDGHVAYRSATPVSGDELEQQIDAMPMRRAGQR